MVDDHHSATVLVAERDGEFDLADPREHPYLIPVGDAQGRGIGRVDDT